MGATGFEPNASPKQKSALSITSAAKSAVKPPENGSETLSLDALVAALANLSEADRQTLAVMLTGHKPK